MRIKQTEVYLKVCVTSQFLVFFTPHVALTFFIFCGVQKDIKKKKKSTTFLRPPWGISEISKISCNRLQPSNSMDWCIKFAFSFWMRWLLARPAISPFETKQGDFATLTRFFRQYKHRLNRLSPQAGIKLKKVRMLALHGYLNFCSPNLFLLVGLFSCCFKEGFLKELGKILIEDEWN